MPGTVRITVLEVVDLPGPSGKKYAIQVSVGARSFSTDEQASTSSGSGTSSIKAFNSDFAFAVLNLTDPVVFTLLDARGVAVCKTSLSVPSVVEKGFRDDMLPWSNGGQVHVKSNFMLSDEERAKIAAMRARSLSKRKDGSSSSTVTPIASGTVTPRTVSAVLASPVASTAPAASEASTATETAAASSTEVTAATTTTTTTTSTTATTETAAAGTVTEFTATSTVSAAVQKESAAVTTALAGSAAAGAPVDMSNVMLVFDGSDDESGYTESSLEESVSAQVAPAAPAAPVASAAVPAATAPVVSAAVPDSVPDVAAALVSQAAQAVQVQDPDSIAPATVEVVKEVQKEVQVTSAQQTASAATTKTDVTIIKTAKQVASEATTMTSAKVASVSTSTKAVASAAGASVQAAMSSTTGRASEQSSVRGGGGVAADLNGRVGSSSRQPAVADSEAAESSWESGDEVESVEGSSVSGTTDRQVVKRGRGASGKGRNRNGGLLGQVLRVGDGLTPVMKQVLGTGAFMLAMVALWPRPQKQSRVQLETDADGKVWVVKPGETLSSILPREVYCNPSSKFFELNPEVCDINRIYSGQRLVLP
ncbi:unnamed protein product [Closterium sp. NIES-53]